MSALPEARASLPPPVSLTLLTVSLDFGGKDKNVQTRKNMLQENAIQWASRHRPQLAAPQVHLGKHAKGLGKVGWTGLIVSQMSCPASCELRMQSGRRS